VRLKDGDRIRLGSTVVLKFVRLDPCEEEFQRQMFERTVRDDLTGLFNRAYFLNQVGPLAEQSAVRGLGVAILMLDVDHFKRVNDRFGHDAGDQVLREVASVLREATRSEDLVARYGGEEFVLALPVVAPDQATERAERIRQTLAERRIIAGGASLQVTASLGLALAPADRVCSTSALITAADRCLYQAKNLGRNRIVFRPDNLLNCWGGSATAVD
jgi:two-component system, cell cycle response regulator